MEIVKAYKFRVYPTAAQAATMTRLCAQGRTVFNACNAQRLDALAKLRTYGRAGMINGRRVYSAEIKDLYKITKFDQGKAMRRAKPLDDFLADVPDDVLDNAVADCDAAWQKFFKGGGVPTFRNKFDDNAFRLRGRSFKLAKLNEKFAGLVGNRLLGRVKIRLHRPVEGEMKNLTFSIDAGRFYVSIQTKQIDVAEPVALSRMIGIDRGVAASITTSDGRQVAMPAERLNVLDRRRRKAQKAVSRGRKGSARRRKAVARLAAVSAKIGRVRKQFNNVQSAKIAARYGVVIVEALKTRNMTATAKGTADAPGRNVKAKAGLNRAILSHNWYQLEQMLAYKLAWRGGHFDKVDPRNTSRECDQCGAIDAASRLSQSEFVCVSCGHEANADINAAKVILKRWCTPCAEGPIADPLKREASRNGKPTKSAGLAVNPSINSAKNQRNVVQCQSVAG